MNILDRVHGEYVHARRVRTLVSLLTEIMPHGAQVLDIGCGDGLLADQLIRQRSDLRIQGIDVLQRDHACIPVQIFDGQSIPFDDASFDVALVVDVLHHTQDPMILLREAVRVVRQGVVIKDHTRNGLLAASTLGLMDWVGNARHGVACPHNYWSRQQWATAFSELKLDVDVWMPSLHLYPAPVDWIFGRGLHFLARLGVSQASIMS